MGVCERLLMKRIVLENNPALNVINQNNNSFQRTLFRTDTIEY